MLDHIRVLDLSDERGQLCGHVLATLGADVIAVEPPGGSRSRLIGPFAEAPSTEPETERSLFHWAYNRGKRSIELDLDRDDDRAELRRLIVGADVLIESAGPGVLDRKSVV